ncbi:MAG: hypothetical protein FJY97_09825 [candidate division Zixibacteria bacterium]|nr:hypothetical protein [candidate division Zixibacteria bacterium]
MRRREVAKETFVRQPRRRLAHVELAGHHIRDKARAVFAEKVNLAFETGDGTPYFSRCTVDLGREGLSLIFEAIGT